MVKTKKPKKVAAKTTFIDKRSTLYGLLFVIIVGVVLYFLWGAHQNTVADNTRVENINRAGVLLDAMKADLEKKGIDAQIKRYSYCWRTGEKYGEGTRYCDQRLSVSATNKDIIAIDKETTIALSSLRDTPSSNLAGDFPESTYKNGLLLDIAPLVEPGQNNSSCVIEINAFSDDYEGANKNSYVVDVICDEKIDSQDIYPVGERFSSLDLLED